MKEYYAYIRVSTAKQGEHGSSLLEQRDAIRAFAARNALQIIAWFEERETAAKLGRREFAKMIVALRKRKASGVIFHKIDRSARNLKDWSAIQDLADEGIDIRFTQESVNLGSNEGKLTGDFLAVISAHYIRNLREEVKKGIRGRLKQGLYPLAAPIGYLDQGGGKPKIPDPQRAPFVRQAFELYGSGAFALRSLAEELYARGFRGRPGNKVDYNRLSEILRNPFYTGIMKLKRSGETYPGVHEPLISAALFEKVQARLDGKLNSKTLTHQFRFRRIIRCAHCNLHAIGERQKGHVYYRCHQCPNHCVREEAVEAALQERVARLTLSDEEWSELRQTAATMTNGWQNEREELLRSIQLQIDALQARLARLTDIFIDGAIERSVFEDKKLQLLIDSKILKEKLELALQDENIIAYRFEGYLELLQSLPLSHQSANALENRQLLRAVTSNLLLDQKNVVVKLKSPFFDLAESETVLSSAPVRDEPRTKAARFLQVILDHCKAQQKKDAAQSELPLAAE